METQERSSMNANSKPTLEQFVKQYEFNPEHTGKVSIRRQFILLRYGTLAQDASRVTSLIGLEQPEYNGWEVGLSEYQLNHHTRFCDAKNLIPLKQEMVDGDTQINRVLSGQDLKLCFNEIPPEIVPETLKTTVAYERLSKRHTREAMLPTLCTNTTCIKVGMPDLETAIHCSNLVSPFVKGLAEKSKAQKLKTWKHLAQITSQTPVPKHYNGVEDFYEDALASGFASDPRGAPSVVSISAQGFLRVECFGTTVEHGPKLMWVQEVMKILKPVFGTIPPK